jgi:hypothetical protein
MTEDKDFRRVAREYIDGALRIQGSSLPSDESYEKAVAGAETAFKRLTSARRRGVAAVEGAAERA